MYKSKKRKKRGKKKKREKEKKKKEKKRITRHPTREAHERHLYKANTHRTAFQTAFRSIPVSRLICGLR